MSKSREAAKKRMNFISRFMWFQPHQPRSGGCVNACTHTLPRAWIEWHMWEVTSPLSELMQPFPVARVGSQRACSCVLSLWPPSLPQTLLSLYALLTRIAQIQWYSKAKYVSWQTVEIMAAEIQTPISWREPLTRPKIITGSLWQHFISLEAHSWQI